MARTLLPPREPKHGRKRGASRAVRRLVENDLIRRVSYEEYRERVRDVYGGPQGALLAAASLVSLHVPLGERFFRERKFELKGAKQILDVGSGAGQIARHILKYGDADLQLTCIDISHEMLRRARNRIKSSVPKSVVADLTRLPFVDNSFDCITCGYVLEHLPDARPGLTELSRVLKPGGRMLLLVTEDTFTGAWTSRFWKCRTYNRRELYDVCQDVGLDWHQDLWFSRLHRWMRAGGICLELRKRQHRN